MKKRINIRVIVILLVIALIITLILRYLTPGLNLQVVSQNPPPNTPVSIYSPITLKLNANMPQTVFDSCVITTDPASEFTKSLNSTEISITPTNRFQLEQSYQLRLQCDNFQYQTYFITTASSQMSLDDIGRLQTEKDLDFANTFKEIYEKDPWKLQLPLETKIYTVVYSDVTNQYYATSTIPQGSKLTRLQLEIEIKEKLKTIGAPDVPILWR